MKLSVLFIQREQAYEGQFAPEAVAIADEYAMEDNPEWFIEQEKTYRSQLDIARVKRIDIEVDGKEIDRFLNQPPLLDGRIVTEEGS